MTYVINPVAVMTVADDSGLRSPRVPRDDIPCKRYSHKLPCVKRRRKHSPSKRRRRMLFQEWRRMAKIDDSLFDAPCRGPTSPQEPDQGTPMAVFDSNAVVPEIPMDMLACGADSSRVDFEPGGPVTPSSSSDDAILDDEPPLPGCGAQDTRDIPDSDPRSPNYLDFLYERRVQEEAELLSNIKQSVDQDSRGIPDSDPRSPNYLDFLYERRVQEETELLSSDIPISVLPDIT